MTLHAGNSMNASPRARPAPKPKAPQAPVMHQPYRGPAPAEALEPHASGRPRRNVRRPQRFWPSSSDDLFLVLHQTCWDAPAAMLQRSVQNHHGLVDNVLLHSIRLLLRIARCPSCHVRLILCYKC